MGDDGFTISKDIGFIHEMSGEDGDAGGFGGEEDIPDMTAGGGVEG